MVDTTLEYFRTMFKRKLKFERKEVEQRLKNLPKDSVALFAHRCAIREIPLLSSKKDFSIWKEEERKENLMSVIRCLDFRNSDTSFSSDKASDAYAVHARSYAAYVLDSLKDKTNLKEIFKDLVNDLASLEAGQTKLPAIKKTHWDTRFIQSLESIGMSYWADVYRQYLTDKIDEGEAQRRRQLSRKLLDSGYYAVTAYLITAKKEGQEKSHEVNVFFVGDSGVGKTSLIEKIINKKAPLPEERTLGIRVKKHAIPDDGNKINIWDLGGQPACHSAHQLFMADDAVYVVVLDNHRQGEADYWLKNIEMFGGNSPVFVVVNKRDKNKNSIARATIKKSFPNVVGIYHIACNRPDAFDFGALLQDFYKSCKEKSKAWTTKYPQRWLEVKASLEKENEPFTTYKSYQRICDKRGILHEKERKELLATLKSFGSLVYCVNLGIKPEWLSGAICKIITSDIIERQQGTIHLQQLQTILNDEKVYPKKQHLFILKIAAKLELCYLVNDGISIRAFFPDSFPVDEPENTSLPTGHPSVLFRYDFEFLPHFIFTRFLCKMQKTSNDIKAWRTGAIITQKRFDNVARMIVNYTKQTIEIEVSGSETRELLQEILYKMDSVFENFNNLIVKEVTPVGTSANGEVILDSYRELAMLKKKGVATRKYGSLAIPVKLKGLLEKIETPESQEERFIHKSMSINPIKKSVKLAKQAKAKEKATLALKTKVKPKNQLKDKTETKKVQKSKAKPKTKAIKDEAINDSSKNQSLQSVDKHLSLLMEDMESVGQVDKILNNRLVKMKKALKEIEKETDPKKAANSSAGLRLKDLHDDFINQESRLNKALKKLDKGWKHASEVAAHYNIISKWSLGSFPQIPEANIRR